MADPLKVSPQVKQYSCPHAFTLTYQAEEHVLRSDEVVAELECLTEESSSTFFARGVNGGDVLVGDATGPTVSATFSRTPSSDMPIDSRASPATPVLS